MHWGHASDAGHGSRDHALLLFRKALAGNRLGEHERAWREYWVGKESADPHLIGAWKDCEMEALRPRLRVPRDEELELQAALYSIAV